MKPIQILNKLNESIDYTGFDDLEDYYVAVDDCRRKLDEIEVGEDIDKISDLDNFVRENITKEAFKEYKKAVSGEQGLNSRLDAAREFIYSLWDKLTDALDEEEGNVVKSDEASDESKKELKDVLDELKKLEKTYNQKIKDVEKIFTKKLNEIDIKDKAIRALNNLPEEDRAYTKWKCAKRSSKPWYDYDDCSLDWWVEAVDGSYEVGGYLDTKLKPKFSFKLDYKEWESMTSSGYAWDEPVEKQIKIYKDSISKMNTAIRAADEAYESIDNNDFIIEGRFWRLPFSNDFVFTWKPGSELELSSTKHLFRD